MTRAVALSVLAVLALGAGALAATRALAPSDAAPPGLTTDATGPLFRLAGLRHGDRAERCVTVTNEGPGEAAAFVLGRVEDGDLARYLAAVVRRGCGEGVVLWSGRLAALREVRDEVWPAGARRRFAIAVEVAGSDAEVQGRRAVQELGFGLRAAPAAPAGPPPAEPPPPTAADSRGEPVAPGCARLTFARGGARRRRPVLVKRRRIDARVTAKLILRIYGAAGQQRLVLVTGLRVGRDVLPGRRYGRVSYRVRDGASVTSRRRPFRVRVAPGALRPGRNVVHVTVVPKGRGPVRARYVLRIAAAPGDATECEIG